MERAEGERGFRWMMRRATLFAVATTLICALIVWWRGGSVASLGYGLIVMGIVFAVVAMGSNGLAPSYFGTVVSSAAASHEAPDDRRRFTAVMLLAAMPLVIIGIALAIAGNRWA